MSPPIIQVNTLVKESDKLYIDPISKMYIFSEVLFGFHRLPLIGKGSFIYVLLTIFVFVALNAAILGMTWCKEEDYHNISTQFQLVQNILCGLLSFARCKRIVSFHQELDKFDEEVGCRPKVSRGCIQNAVQAVITSIFVATLFLYPLYFSIKTPVYFIPIQMVYTLEVHYFGHLLSLLIPRLKLINYYIESALASAKTEPSPLLKQFVYFKCYDVKVGHNHMSKLMDLYQIIVEAYAHLIEGIKWQLLVIIISAFLSILGFLYVFSMTAIHEGMRFEEDSITKIGVTIAIMSPLFAPCTFGDRVHNEVIKLRELLASRLYENKLDKSGRCVARALLAFTETRDLSFRLLRMLNIDISLPFKFVGLLVTYLIILLQFEKVINP